MLKLEVSMFRFSHRMISCGKKVMFRVGVATTVAATCQGIWYRHKYESSAGIPLPSGPMAGIERWLGKVRSAGIELQDQWSELSQSDVNLIGKLKSFIEKNKNFDALRNKNSATPRKKVKLLILGDSLVRGVGCDDAQGSSPVLPCVLAKVLSLAFQVDVQWRAEGLIGGTVASMRTKFLPIVQEEMLIPESESTEFIVILICGLNDWKTLLTEFPWGRGPNMFRAELSSLISEIKSLAGSRPCRVILPALPIICGQTDPNCILQHRPLKFFVDIICWTWDLQKKHIAEDSSEVISILIFRLLFDGNNCTVCIYIYI